MNDSPSQVSAYLPSVAIVSGQSPAAMAIARVLLSLGVPQVLHTPSATCLGSASDTDDFRCRILKRGGDPETQPCPELGQEVGGSPRDPPGGRRGVWSVAPYISVRCLGDPKGGLWAELKNLRIRCRFWGGYLRLCPPDEIRTAGGVLDDLGIRWGPDMPHDLLPWPSSLPVLIERFLRASERMVKESTWNSMMTGWAHLELEKLLLEYGIKPPLSVLSRIGELVLMVPDLIYPHEFDRVKERLGMGGVPIHEVVPKIIPLVFKG